MDGFDFREFITNRYTRYFVICFFVGVLLYLVLWILHAYIDFFTHGIRLLLSALVSGILVYKFIFSRLG